MKELEKKVAEAELKKVKDEILTYCTKPGTQSGTDEAGRGIVLGKCSHCSRGRDGPRRIIKGGKQNGQRNDEPRKAAGGGLL